MKVPHKIACNYWESDLHKIEIKTTHPGETTIYWAVLRIYSPKFGTWSEHNISPYPFRSEAAAKRFIKVFVQGFNLRHNLSSHFELAGWPDLIEAAEPQC